MFDLIGNVFDIVSAPVRVAASVAKAVTEPIADVCNEIVDEVDEFLEE